MPAAPMYGRLPIVKMLLVTIALTVVISAVMVPINWNGQGASTAAPKIDHLLNVMIVLSAFVFSLVMVMLFYALWKFKAKPGDESDGEPIHGNTRLEIAWTLIPTVIVLFAGGYSWKVLDDIEEPNSKHLTVSVFSQQYAWSFAYPGKGYAYSEGELHVPVDRQIQFKMHAMDVIHSFWVPEWRIKKDNVPGITTTAIVTPDKEGTYQLVCTELCGFGHATMRAKVVVESPAKFNEWVEGLKQDLPEPFMDVLKEESVSNPPALDAGGA
ncbi:MAG TPA: cytochrome c oxidase subunit II [Solirubrobacterales bacterium]|nr:cytochrome c oxidase subunit II [Solirubrobacterales bacterium]